MPSKSRTRLSKIRKWNETRRKTKKATAATSNTLLKNVKKLISAQSTKTIVSVHPPFPTPFDFPVQKPPKCQARIVDFWGGSCIPRQMSRWLQVCGFTVFENFYQNQINKAFGCIAALVIKTIYLKQSNDRRAFERETASCNCEIPIANAPTLMGKSRTNNTWLIGDDIRRLLMLILHLVQTELNDIVFFGNYSVVLSLLFPNHFARHNSELTNSERYYAVNTDASGTKIHWFLIAITFIAGKEVFVPNRRGPLFQMKYLV